MGGKQYSLKIRIENMMTEKSQDSLKSIERRVYLSYHGDGLWDLFLGLFFLGMGLFMIFDQPYLMGALAVVILPLAQSIKKAITRPRMGYVEFSSERQAKQKRGRTKMSFLLTFTMILGVVVFMAYYVNTEWGDTIKSLGLIPFGFVLTLVIGAVGMLFDLRRFYLYAALVLAVFIAGHVLHTHPAFYLLLVGAVVTITGTIMLIRFLRKYPKAAEGAYERV
jgi:hypothetical protein